MSQLIINTNKGTADTLKSGATKINSNFTELYAIIATDQISIPALLGNSGKYLTTNGTTVSWQSFTVPDVTIGSYANPTWITSLDYSKLTNTPNLANYLTASSLSVSTITPSGAGALSYSSGVFTYTPPNLAAVATSGSYADLTNKPTITTIPTQTANGGKYLTTDGTTLSWATVTSGTTDYNNLTNKPTIPAAQVQTDWTAVSGLGVVLNKPTLFSGSYIDLTNKPTIPAAQVQTDWTAVSGLGVVLNKPTLFSGSYIDLTNKPTIPSSLSTLSGVSITSPTVGQVLKYNGLSWINDADAVSGGAGVGTVTNVSVASANGFAGSVATASSTPAITITTSITGLLKGNGTAISAASAGTDYQAPITLTTTGSSGAATFSSNTLNIPQYAVDVVGPITATDNAITRFDNTTGKLLQSSLVTISDSGAIVAPIASSIIPFHYDNQAGFPSATTYHGAIAHSHADGKMYFAHSGTWLALANVSDLPAAYSATSIDALSDVDTTTSAPANGQALVWNSAGSKWSPGTVSGGGSGTVTSTSVVSANGFAGTVATSTSTPAITITTSITGVLKGNGTAISAAVSGTDYQAPIGTISGLVKGNGANALTAAVAGTDYQSAQSVTGIVKSSGTTRSAAVAGTDYIAPYTSQTANTHLAAPSGTAGVPTFRLLTTADIPSTLGTTAHSGTVTLNASANLVFTGSTSGTVTFVAGVSPANQSYTLPSAYPGVAGYVLSSTTLGVLSWASAASGTVTSVSVASANGFAGTVATASSTPAITITTSITGLLKGGSSAISAAVSGTDYQAPIGTISGLVKGNGANALTAAVAGTDYQAPIGTISGLVKGNGANALTAAVAGTDYQAPISLTTTGSSGAATFNGTTLNIPQYSGGASSFSALSDATSATLTVDKIYLPAITRLNVTANGASSYSFDQYAATNPTIYAISGTTIAFNLNVSGHPFLIRTSGAVNYDTGLVHVSITGTVSTGASAQGQVSGTLYWKIPFATTGNYQYICSIHGGMVGVITIKDFSIL